MVLEWIRRRDPIFDENLRKYLFTTTSITGSEEAGKDQPTIASSPVIGSLRQTRGSK